MGGGERTWRGVARGGEDDQYLGAGPLNSLT